MKIPNIPCDVCKQNPAKKWFGNTSVVICENEECYERMQEIYKAECERVRENYERERE